MKQLNSYITEKLRLDKSEHIKSSEKYEMNWDNMITLKGVFKDGQYDSVPMEYKIRRLGKSGLIKLHTDTMFFTGSFPYIDRVDGHDTVVSFPGNYGRDIIERLKKFEVDPEEIFFDYNINDNKNYESPLYDDFTNEYIKAINSLLKHYGFSSYGVKLRGQKKEDYSEKAREIRKTNKFVIFIPFTLSFTTDTKIINIDCEIGYSHGTYYHYQVNGKNFSTSEAFAKEINNLIN